MTTIALIGWALTLLLVPAAGLVGYRYGLVIADRDSARRLLLARQITEQSAAIAAARGITLDEARRAIERALEYGPRP